MLRVTPILTINSVGLLCASAVNWISEMLSRRYWRYSDFSDLLQLYYFDVIFLLHKSQD